MPVPSRQESNDNECEIPDVDIRRIASGDANIVADCRTKQANQQSADSRRRWTGRLRAFIHIFTRFILRSDTPDFLQCIATWNLYSATESRMQSTARAHFRCLPSKIESSAG